MAMTRLKAMGLAALATVTMLVAGPSRAGSEARFGPTPPVDISFVQFQSPDLTKPPGTMLTIKGKLSVPPIRRAARVSMATASFRRC